ncbi:hypothetical protein GCM10027051_01390 [Niabella terrae]
MKTVFYLVLMMAVALISCKKSKDDSNPPPQVLLARVSSPGTFTTYEYNNQGQVIASKSYFETSPANNYSATNLYDASGRLSNWDIKRDDPGLPLTRLSYKYNNSNQLILTETFLITGLSMILTNKVVLTYSPGKIAVTQTDYPSETQYLKAEYFTDENKNLAKLIDYQSDGSVSMITEYDSYDDKPNAITSIPATSIFRSRNNSLSMKRTDLLSGSTSERIYTYTYNESGYPVERATSGTASTTIYEYILR